MGNRCPYPGLRPFREEEAIYFKGREEQVQKIAEVLEGKKFLMLTGASGDGKSSLVYAGFIPYVKAGFFKARFNNWIIADFRPERSPLTNLAKSLTRHLGLKDQQSTERELSFGFSSLVHLYKSSSHHLDYKSPQWLNATEAEKKELKKKASNLIILTDQFEEFFTNSENYVNDTPSLQSQVVVNLLLETTRIALEEDLPIYIVCTMRSDFIGQCVSFRGLPEYVGVNQFFVPRLKRNEIHQIIAEPATLNGDKISNRLVETLINQLGEGYDQLPVLQHALKQLWIKGQQSEQEMDLLHLAILSGLKADYLPPADKVIFDNWIGSISEYKKSFFEKPSLGNVLHFHANELYENAYDYYNRKTSENQNQLTQEEAKQIIKKTFQCLTKIDGARAVRNRMTLQEVVNIINDPQIDGAVVGGLLEIFRDTDSTFIRPFILTDGIPPPLHPNDVLDITHESLIRNWELLREWTIEENENWVTFQDFDKQLQRWIENKKSKDYLLPLGSLAFFEAWYSNCNPNKYWLKKYDESLSSDAEKNYTAQLRIDDTTEFLNSSRKALRKKRNIVIAATVSVMIFTAIFSIWALVERGKAMDQRKLADNKTSEALDARKEAIYLKNTAESAEQKALESQIVAVAAKDTALKAKERALISESEALRSKARAESEALNALQQSELAKKETEEAERQKKLSEKEKEKAESAELKAKQLSFISLSQNLALKATLQDDEQLKGLLALQAYRFTKQNGGNVQTPIIYEALRSAYSSLASQLNINGSTSEPRTIVEPKSGSFISAGKDGLLNKWDLSSGNIKTTSKLNYQSPIDFITFNQTGSLLVTGHLSNTICVWNVDKAGDAAPIELKGQNGLLRAVSFNPDGHTLATGGKDSLVLIWNGQSGKILKTINVRSYVKALQFIDVNTIAVVTDDGMVEIISVSDETSRKIYVSKNSQPLCCRYIGKKNLLAVGFSDGKIRLFDLSSTTISFKEINDNFSRAELMTIDSRENLLAVAFSDKSIKVYSTENSEVKPIQFKDHKSKVRSLLFDVNDKLLAGCEDKSIRVWETSSEKLANQLCSFVKRNMTAYEWKQFIGNEISYEKTCANAIN